MSNRWFRPRWLIALVALITAAGVGIGLWTTGASSATASTPVKPDDPAVNAAEAARQDPDARVRDVTLNAAPTTLRLDGKKVSTWAFNGKVPGPEIRLRAGDVLQARVNNGLPDPLTVHWHGIAIRNDMDGVPDLTQQPIAPGAQFVYQFTVSHPGTYFYHPHTGVQLDRGLYGVLVIEDPHQAGDYDEEWIVVLDDWIDGTGKTPDDVLDELRSATSSPGDMGGMDMGGSPGGMGGMGESMQSDMLGGAGDIDYPHYLVNGRTPGAPAILNAAPGQRVRIRIINAASDTAFRVALGSHRMSVTHSDGFPVTQQTTDALLIAMGERYDVIVTVADGIFPLVASAEGKTGQGIAVVRTGSGSLPGADVQVPELRRNVLTSSDLTAAESAQLSTKTLDRRIDVTLGGTMAPYRWTINDRAFADAEPLEVSEGDRVRLRFQNRTMMFHPMHLHGHTYALVRGGARKDTTIVRPMQTVEVDFDAMNPGQWATHCHNIYHAESGMMTTVSYRS